MRCTVHSSISKTVCVFFSFRTFAIQVRLYSKQENSSASGATGVRPFPSRVLLKASILVKLSSPLHDVYVRCTIYLATVSLARSLSSARTYRRPVIFRFAILALFRTTFFPLLLHSTYTPHHRTADFLFYFAQVLFASHVHRTSGGHILLLWLHIVVRLLRSVVALLS